MRIDSDRFLTHMIDHFTLENLISDIQFIIIGSTPGPGNQQSISEHSMVSNVIKINELYPSREIQEYWSDYKDRKILKKIYIEYLEDPRFGCESKIYLGIVELLLKHHNICLICKPGEYIYLDIFCEYLEDKYNIPSVDLNKLFIEGKIDGMYLDFKDIHNSAVDIRRKAVQMMKEDALLTKRGRTRLFERMSKKDKIKVLKSVGINVTESDKKNLDRLVIEAWVEEAPQD